MKPQHTPGNPVSRKYLADKFDLTMLVDTSPRRMKAQFIIKDTVPAEHIKLLPRGYWRTIR